MINPLPVNIAYSLGADSVIAVNVAHSPEISFQKKNGKSKRTAILKKNLSHVRISIFKQMKKMGKLKLNVASLERSGSGNTSRKDTPTSLGIVDNILQGTYILQNRIIQLQLQLEKPDLLISPDINDFKMLEFHRAKELIATGENVALAMLPQINKLAETSLEKNYVV